MSDRSEVLGQHSEGQDAAAAHGEFRIRSYVLRQGRLTTAQGAAIERLSARYVISSQTLKEQGAAAVFGRQAPLVVEVGFGMARSFIEMAKNDQERNYLGIEVHQPGVGAALLLIEQQGLENVRIISEDAFLVLRDALPPESVAVLQVFFPDPWPKKRHHKRRLINDEFVGMVAPLLEEGGEFRLATDWEEYAQQMLEVLCRCPLLRNSAPDGTFVPRPKWRPLTKFELRGERLGHGVWDLVFTKIPAAGA